MMSRLSPAARLGLVMAGLSIGTKALIVAYGLPFEFNPDEPSILKEPFKLTYLYSQGVFAYPTNLFFWIVQGWYGLLFVLGRLFSHWNSSAAFLAALVAESPDILLWGRLLGVVASACAVYVLSHVIVRTTAGWWYRLPMAASIALNPVDLVSSAWLKFDGMALLLNAILIAAFVRYLDSESPRDRQRLYLLAILAYSLRVDLIVFTIVAVLYDLARRRPFRPVLKPSLIGAAGYCLVTLLPVVVVYRLVTPQQVARAMTVASTFEVNILGRFATDVQTDALWQNPGAGVWFYLPILLNVGLPFLVITIQGLRRDAHARLMLAFAAVTAVPMLLSSAVATRYTLQLSVYLLLGAAWAISRMSRKAMGVGLALLCFGTAASLTLEALFVLRTQRDPRLEAAEYLLSHSNPSDVMAIEDYKNPGFHAEVAECPEELKRKAAATIETGSGTGETFAAWAARPSGDCRPVIEVTEMDRFAGSSYRGRWINTYDTVSWSRMAHPPKFFTTNMAYGAGGADPKHPEFAQFLLQNYELVRVFGPTYRDPRVRALLESTPYYARLYVYQRKS